jgi:S1-C subfamily serine protease
MSRLIPYFSMVLMVGAGMFLYAVSYPTPRVAPSVPATLPASSTLVVLPNAIVPRVRPVATATTSVAESKVSIPEKVKTVVKGIESVSPVVVTQAPTPVPLPTPTIISGDTSFDTSAAALRGALVNIICYAPPSSSLHSISGSGIIIDAKGIILTNAHIAQYFLLADHDVSCTLRTGSPAADAYQAALIYLSPSWVNANAQILAQANPTGTGEYDFALLAITKSATNNPLPSSFPAVSLAELPPSAGESVVIASYGAQFLATSQVQSALSPTIVFGSVKNVFTFATDTIDVLDLGGSAAAQEGSSGGGVADATGALVGTITTTTTQSATSARSLGAITASYIRSEYAREMGSSLDTLLSLPTATAVASFAPQIALLESRITVP